MLLILLLAFRVAAGAQAAPMQTAVLASNGPVVADYGRDVYPNTPEGRIAKEVRHELLMLPYYSLFDDLEYSVQGNTTTELTLQPATHS